MPKLLICYHLVWGKINYQIPQLLRLLSKKIIPVFIIGFGVLFFHVTTFAQTNSLKSELEKLSATSDSFHHKKPAEKLYVQFDKSNYAIGDTIWFKAYLLDAAYLMASAKSGILHVDIVNDSNKVIKQFILPVQNGLTWGNIGLNEKEFFGGTYTIYAYTKWMRNFGEDCFYAKQFYITSSNEHGWLINSQASASNGKNEINARLTFTNPDKTPIALSPLNLQVTAANKNLYKQKLTTDVNGVLNVSFTKPEKATKVNLIAEDEKRSRSAIIPVGLNLAQNADVQFLPEGGNLLDGLPARIGFKAIGEDGKGINISGIVVNQNQKQVAAFKSVHLGMGSFDLTINDGQIYTAKVTLPGGAIKAFPLPTVKKSGTVLQVKNLPESDSVEVTVAASNDIVQALNSYFLIGKSRGIVCYAAVVSFQNSNTVRNHIAKNLFPTGVAHFTLMNINKQVLNERMVFIDHHDNLNVQISTDKPSYIKRDSVALHLKVTDNNGNPVRGNFSLAVTDNNQVKADTLNNDNIVCRMLLASDLKEYTKEPGFYLATNTKDRAIALDNLLLTQGWTGYNWQEVLNPTKIKYGPEQEALVKGSVFNVFNKPVRGTKVQLFSKSPFLLMDTVTNDEGKFTFRHLPAIDTPVFVIKAVNKSGKSFNVGIRAEETPLPIFSKITEPPLLPWYVNSDTTLLNYTRHEMVRQQQPFLPSPGMHTLKEVNITARKTIKGSQNLNGTGNADVVIDEKELEKAGKKTFLQLLEEKVKGFRVGSIPKDLINWYFVKDKWAIIIVDGVRLSDFYEPRLSYLDYVSLFLDLKNYLNLHNAEDIKGIEVNFSGKYSSNYVQRFMNPPLWDPVKLDYVFIEITTRSGQGPFIDNTPGMYLYKPLALSLPKLFYKPKYAVKDAAYPEDFRSTITWEPNLITDKNGNATVSFYTADQPSTYTFTLNGSDLNGNLGFKTGQVSISKKYTP